MKLKDVKLFLQLFWNEITAGNQHSMKKCKSHSLFI